MMTESFSSLDWRLYPVIDVSNVAWRTVFGVGVRLSYGEVETTIAYGIFQLIERLQRDFFVPLDKITFAFDHPPLHRKKLYPAYKSKRKDREKKDPQAQERRAAVDRQIKAFRYEYLPEMGFTRILAQKGFEADDMIAYFCESLPDERVLILSNDKDLYQCLSKNHYIWNGKECFTRKKFKQTYGINCRCWVDVKTIAGCTSDDIPGVPGVGEKTALQYLKGEVVSPARLQAIKKAEKGGDLDLYRSLVSLPLAEHSIDIDISSMPDNKVRPKKVAKVFERLGIERVSFTF